MTGPALRGVWVAIIAVLALAGGCGLDAPTTVGPSTSVGVDPAPAPTAPAENLRPAGPGLALSILPVGSSEQAIT